MLLEFSLQKDIRWKLWQFERLPLTFSLSWVPDIFVRANAIHLRRLFGPQNSWGCSIWCAPKFPMSLAHAIEHTRMTLTKGSLYENKDLCQEVPGCFSDKKTRVPQKTQRASETPNNKEKPRKSNPKKIFKKK